MKDGFCLTVHGSRAPDPRLSTAAKGGARGQRGRARQGASSVPSVLTGRGTTMACREVPGGLLLTSSTALPMANASGLATTITSWQAHDGRQRRGRRLHAGGGRGARPAARGAAQAERVEVGVGPGRVGSGGWGAVKQKKEVGGCAAPGGSKGWTIQGEEKCRMWCAPHVRSHARTCERTCGAHHMNMYYAGKQVGRQAGRHTAAPATPADSPLPLPSEPCVVTLPPPCVLLYCRRDRLYTESTEAVLKVRRGPRGRCCSDQISASAEPSPDNVPMPAAVLPCVFCLGRGGQVEKNSRECEIHSLNSCLQPPPPFSPRSTGTCCSPASSCTRPRTGGRGIRIHRGHGAHKRPSPPFPWLPPPFPLRIHPCIAPLPPPIHNLAHNQ